MNAVVEIPVPATWRQVAPPASDYVVDEHVDVRVSVVQGMPEDPPEWMKVEVARLAGAHPVTGPALEQITTETGWPALVATATAGADTIVLVMYQFLEHAAVATVRGPTEHVATHQAAVMEVLMRAQVRWGTPPTTLADLLEGSVRSA